MTKILDEYEKNVEESVDNILKIMEKEPKEVRQKVIAQYCQECFEYWNDCEC